MIVCRIVIKMVKMVNIDTLVLLNVTVMVNNGKLSQGITMLIHKVRSDGISKLAFVHHVNHLINICIMYVDFTENL